MKWRSKKGSRYASMDVPREGDSARKNMTNGNIGNINYMGNTRKFGNISNIENIIHEPATTNRKKQ